MNRHQSAILIYALINIAMGLHGYFGAHSLPSIIAGSIVGLLCIFFAALSKTNPRVGYIGAAVVALLTAGQWIPHLFKDGNLVIYPALIGLVLSAALTLYLVAGHFLAKRRTAKAAAAAPVGDHHDKGKSH